MFAAALGVRDGSGANFSKCPSRVAETACPDYAAITASQIAGMVAGRAGQLANLELVLSDFCCEFNSADRDPCGIKARLNPSIGRIRCFMRR
jgi:hypothetical protein